MGSPSCDAADRVRLALDVRLRRVEDLLQRLPRRRDRGAEALHPLGQALRERARIGGADRHPARRRGRRRIRAARVALPPAGSVTPSFARHSWICACSAAVGGAIARVTSIRSPPVWIWRRSSAPCPPGAPPGASSPAETAATPSSSAISAACLFGEGELRAREEEVVDELLARLAQLGEVGDRRPDSPRRRRAAAAAERVRLLLRGRARHGQVGADRRQRVERRALRLVESLRQARDRDHEADTEGEPEQRQDGPAGPAPELQPRYRR